VLDKPEGEFSARECSQFICTKKNFILFRIERRDAGKTLWGDTPKTWSGGEGGAGRRKSGDGGPTLPVTPKNKLTPTTGEKREEKSSIQKREGKNPVGAHREGPGMPPTPVRKKNPECRPSYNE